jgi:hypothetical protein
MGYQYEQRNAMVSPPGTIPFGIIPIGMGYVLKNPFRVRPSRLLLRPVINNPG